MMAVPPPTAFASGQMHPPCATRRPLTISSSFTWAAAALIIMAAAPRVDAAAQSYPYFPTQILAPNACFQKSACQAPDLAYVFTQGDDGNVQFSSLNISHGVDANTKLTTLSSDLPFLGGDNAKDTSFGAVRGQDGSVLAYAGQCDQGPGNVWTFGADGDYSWVKKVTTIDKSQTSASASSRGPYFLGGTIAFSATLAPTVDEPTIYSYGGMCATPQSDVKNWQSNANYTQNMLGLVPSDKSPSSSGYSLAVASVSGPKTPMAGFSLTPLQSSISNSSGTVTQQIAYVVLGGHTKQAFINMSTAAVWNLPEESWSYVSVQAPDTNNGGKRQDTPGSVDSRSGHTSVLSEDGRSIVVLGGWVGDVTNPAEPQLAVLEMNQTYSSWRWSIPKSQPKFGGGSGGGLYGHGAAILPGNVMMVYGGWQISDSSSSRVKRQAASTTSPQFFNLTSLSWSTSYTNPNPNAASTSSASSTTSAASGGNASPAANNNPSNTLRLGLGLGLGLGIGALLLIVAIVTFCCLRRRRKRRAEREETIRTMAQDANLFAHDTSEMAERDDLFPWSTGGFYTGGQDPYRTGDRSLGYESIAGGSRSSYGGYAPVAPGVARKPVARQLRGGYVPANLNTAVYPPGEIHPIMEDEEEDLAHQRISHHDVTTPTSEVHTDPFLTPTAANPGGGFPSILPPVGRGSATPSPEGSRRHDPDVQDWVSDVDAADAMLARYNSTRQSQGRGSPTRRNSHRSGVLRDDDSRTASGLSESNRSAVDSLNRSHSGRWSAIAAGTVGIFGGAALIGTTEPGKPGSSSSSSYNTAKSGFVALQAEGPNLLMGRSGSPFEDDEIPQPSSPSKSKPRRSWLGSLKRVFSGPESASGDLSLKEDSNHDESIFSADYEPAVSAVNSELLKRKQGRQDWEGGESSAVGGERENDWDIERAVEQRLVQVMFTVPKERLRVVNADDDDGVETDENQPLHQPHTAELVDPDKSTEASSSIRTHSRLGSHHQDDEEGGVAVDEGDRDDGFLRVEHDDFEDRRLSHSTEGSFARSATVYTAEAMTMERPKTRVLQMVDSIESKSQESSPAVSRTGSPVRSMKSKKSLRNED